jgi:hypothetical protein
MRRLAIVFVALAAIHTIESVASSGTFPGSPGMWRSVCQTPRCINQALISLSEWRKFLIGRLSLTASALGSRLLGEMN